MCVREKGQQGTIARRQTYECATTNRMNAAAGSAGPLDLASASTATGRPAVERESFGFVVTTPYVTQERGVRGELESIELRDGYLRKRVSVHYRLQVSVRMQLHA